MYPAVIVRSATEAAGFNFECARVVQAAMYDSDEFGRRCNHQHMQLIDSDFSMVPKVFIAKSNIRRTLTCMCSCVL